MRGSWPPQESSKSEARDQITRATAQASNPRVESRCRLDTGQRRKPAKEAKELNGSERWIKQESLPNRSQRELLEAFWKESRR